MSTEKHILLSWVAFANDPYERDRVTRQFIEKDGKRTQGPTLNLLFHDESEFKNKIDTVVLLYRESTGETKKLERQVVDDIKKEIGDRDKSISTTAIKWDHQDPTDLNAIFSFLKEALPKIRKAYSGRNLVIHISPGTPAMQTIWVLMAETGFIEEPFCVVKSYREKDRHGRPPVVPVNLGLETFYKTYKRTKPKSYSTEESSISWDQALFKSTKLKELYNQAARIAQLKVPVMLLGERGTGKTTLANWIRFASPFKKASLDKDWPIVVCGQYTPETMRAELFGYVKGAFTGANKDKDGLLVKADKDTLFLDEIGDIREDLQRLIIKAVEDKIFTPLGSEDSKTSDFRLITATNLKWDQIVERLNPDFLDRISHLQLTFPPLREIPEDIPWIWENVFEEAIKRSCIKAASVKLNKKYHLVIVNSLKKHPLPGNLRDLYRIAYTLISLLNDAFSPVPVDEAIQSALSVVNKEMDENTESKGIAKRVMQCFAKNEPLDSFIPKDSKLMTKYIDKEFKKYLAKELERIAKNQSVSVEKLCDVNKRTIHNWKE